MAAMTEWYQRDLTSLAFLWRLERSDGVTIGFTSHDHDLTRGDLIYRATPGLVPSAIERSDGLDADTIELAGALTSDALRSDDLLSGRWDGASLWVSAVDWDDAAAAPLLLVRGELGSVDVQDNAFSAELRGISSLLDMPVVEETSPACRASLGDKKCQIDLARLQSLVGVTAQNSGVLINGGGVIADGIYAFGSVRWVDGANAGLTSRIVNNVGASLQLREPAPFPVLPNTRVHLTQGCDRRFTTCVNRFANAANFRGEPHVPGNDLLTRYAS
jgi:uncharacterized phage protein (TIGR02218 family)